MWTEGSEPVQLLGADRSAASVRNVLYLLRYTVACAAASRLPKWACSSACLLKDAIQKSTADALPWSWMIVNLLHMIITWAQGHQA